MSEEMKSCPFCGSAAIGLDYKDGLVWVGCECGCRGEWFRDSQELAAIKAWNTRPDSKRPDLTNYPNLVSVLQGCVSGTFGEWPGVRAELSQLIESFGVPDSKPYRHKDFQAYYGNSKDLSFVDKFERKAAQAGFDAARELKEG